jgi:CelD/BcsL family acetyltransferase involved in cellulose biosynthesis
VTWSLRVVEATSFEEVERFQTGWDRLASLHRWPFAEFAWLRDGAKYVTASRNVFICLVVDESALVAAIAFSGTARRSLELIGSTEFCEASPLLSAHAQATSCLVEHLVARGIPFSLTRVLEPEQLAACMSSATAGKGLMFVRESSGAPYLNLPKTEGEFSSGLTSSRRNMLSRKRRKLGQRGALAFEASYPTTEEVLKHLAEFEQLEASGWKGQRGSAITMRRGFHEFFSATLQANAEQRRVRIDRLALDGKTIAIQFGLVAHGRYFLIKPTFDERWGELSPGQQLTHDAILESIRERLETYEFLGSDEQWKLLWADQVRASRSWVYYPFNTRGLIRLSADATRALARKVMKRANPGPTPTQSSAKSPS